MMMGGMSGSGMGMMDMNMMNMGGSSMNAANMSANMGQMMPMDSMSQMNQMAPVNQMSPMFQMGQMSPAHQMAPMVQGGGYGSMYGLNDPGAMSGMANHGTTQGLAGYGSNAGLGLGSFDFNTIVSGLLNFGIKLFFLLLLVGLLVGTIIFLKQYLIDANNRNPRAATTGTGFVCSSCGHSFRVNGWPAPSSARQLMSNRGQLCFQPWNRKLFRTGLSKKLPRDLPLAA